MDREINSAEEAIGCAIFDLLAETHSISGIFTVELEDDGSYFVGLLEPPEDLVIEIEDEEELL